MIDFYNRKEINKIYQNLLNYAYPYDSSYNLILSPTKISHHSYNSHNFEYKNQLKLNYTNMFN
jgi:hypothetical protein